MKTYASKVYEKNDTITIFSKGLTKEENEEVRKLVSRLERKRSREKRSRLMHNIIIC